MSIHFEEVLAWVESRYPLSEQEDWDQCGLWVSPKETMVQRVGVCLSLSREIIDEATKEKVGLILGHHPLFAPLPEENGESGENHQGSRIEELKQHLLQKGIGYYALHTNFDKLGMGTFLGRKLGLQDLRILDPGTGMGVVGRLETAISRKELLSRIAHVFGLDHIRHSKVDLGVEVSTIGLCGGAGKDLMEQGMTNAGAYLTGDLTYHNFELAEHEGFFLVDLGHFGPEESGMNEFSHELSFAFPGHILYLSGREPSKMWFSHKE